MDNAVDLFTRSQISDLAKIPGDVLNYWMREGVLRPREGGEGRGLHRRFDYPEVMLAAILDQLRGFGLGLPALSKLADRFHRARDYMDGLGITRANYSPLSDLIRMKRDTIEKGTARAYQTDNEQFPGIVWEPNEFGPGASALVTFDQLMKYPHLWLNRDDRPRRVEVVEIATRIIRDLDPYEFFEHWSYWADLTMITNTEPDLVDGGLSSSPSYFYRDSAGDWHLIPDAGDAGRASIAFIGVNTEVISWRLWHGNGRLNA